MISYLLVALGGAAGAVARFATVTITQAMIGTRFPVGTLLVNCLGAFLMGLSMSFLIERVADAEYWRLFLVVGFLGGYTTFSGFSWETWALGASGEWTTALFNIVLTNVLTIFAMLLGIQLARLPG